MSRRPESGPPAADRGTVTMFAVFYTIPVLLLVGLIVDGGYAIHARQKAYDIAEQAARAGANDIDIATLRSSGKVRVNPDIKDVRKKVDAFIASYPSVRLASHTTTESANHLTVSVTVTIKQKASFLSILPGLSEFTLTATASATPEEG